MISIEEVSMYGLSLAIPFGYSFESSNPGAGISDTLMGVPLGIGFVSEEVRCLCFFWRFIYFHEATCWGVGIFCVPPSGAFSTSKINSVSYFQLLYFLTFSLSPTWFVPTSGGSWIADELSTTVYMPFTLVMDEDSYRLAAELSGWAHLLGPLVVWDSPSIGVQVNLLKYSSSIGIVDDTVGFWLGSELGSPLWALIQDLLQSSRHLPMGLPSLLPQDPRLLWLFLGLTRYPSDAWAQLALPLGQSQ